MVREWLTHLIDSQHDMVVCGQCATILEAQEILTTSAPDLVIIDLGILDERGENGISLLRAKAKSLRFLVFSKMKDEPNAERALRRGASGYINYREPGENVVAAIRTVLAGGIHLQELAALSILRRLAEGWKKSDALSPDDILSTREMHLFDLMGKGYRPREMARLLNLSASTVGNYTERMKQKLRVTSCRDLVKRAVDWQITAKE